MKIEGAKALSCVWSSKFRRFKTMINAGNYGVTGWTAVVVAGVVGLNGHFGTP